MKLFIKKNYSKYKEVFYYILLFMIFYFSIPMNVFILVLFILGLIATIISIQRRKNVRIQSLLWQFPLLIISVFSIFYEQYIFSKILECLLVIALIVSIYNELRGIKK
jgi:uncharacterized membrane protein YfcA